MIQERWKPAKIVSKEVTIEKKNKSGRKVTATVKTTINGKEDIQNLMEPEAQVQAKIDALK
jgi:K(+)-stimulated pyrophosphate-energized sodium pump